MLPAFCPPQLQGLLDCMQVVVHKDNLRHNIGTSNFTDDHQHEPFEMLTKVILFHNSLLLQQLVNQPLQDMKSLMKPEEFFSMLKNVSISK